MISGLRRSFILQLCVIHLKDKTEPKTAKMQQIFFKIATKAKNAKLKDKLLHKPDTIDSWYYSQVIRDKGRQPHSCFTRITCYVDYPFGSWSPWIPDCSLPVSGVTPVNQSRTRSRECNISSDCTPCPLDVETRAGL